MMNKLFFSIIAILGLTVTSIFAQTFSNGTTILNSVPGTSNRPCVVDMDGDGLDDVVRISGNTVYIDFQQEDGTFDQENYNVPMQNTASWSIAAGDVDDNGFCDIMLGGGSRASFLMAFDDGSGFEEIFFDEYIFCQRTNFADIDNDGNLDAFSCHDTDTSHPFRNDGNGNLSEDQTLIPTVELGGNYASIFTDFDNDGDLDMHMAKCRQGTSPGDPQRMNGLYQNNGDGTFTEVAEEYGMNDGDQSWVTVFEDFDNDGDFDAYTVNHYEANILYENDGTGHMTQVTAGSGINSNDLGSWACIGADFDNDGFVDILSESGSNDEYYHNNGDFTFTSSEMDFNDGSLCDLNNDGFIDVFTGSTLWLNDGNDNNWIKFNVEGLISNASGIGTRIEIFGDFGIQVREVRAGQGYAPMSSLTQFFGLGTYDEIETVVVTWPSGTVTTINNPEINTTIDVIEADCLFDTDPITASGPLELCPGETVTLTAPAGYEYTWNQGQGNSQTITVSEAGNYQVILGEIGGECLSISNSLLVTIDNLEAPTISFDGNNVSCASDPITLEASEGLSYQWSTNENTQSITVNESGVYTVSVEGACGAVTSEELELEFYQVADPVTNVNVEVSDAGDLTLEATGDNITWFSDNAGTDVVGTGNTLDINVTDEATYYVQNSLDFPGALQEGGKPSFAGGGGLPSSGGGSTFDVWEEFTLLTVLVNATQPGMRTVNLVNGNGAVLESITQFMDGEMILELNWTIPVGEEYQILCEENNLFRNNSGVSYPYPIGDVGSIYTSTFGGQYYYYFYDWQIQKQSFFCLSDLIEINVSVVGLDELSQVSGLEVFPNPSSDFINVGLNLKEDLNLQIELINSVGQKVISKNLGDRQAGEFLEQIDVRGFAPGTYELVLSNEKGQQVISVVIE